MTDFLTELKEINESKFRFQNQKALFTYKTHIDKDKLREFLFSFGKFKCYIAHENGEGDSITPYEHTHVVVDFGKALDKKSSRVFDFEGIHPHIRLIVKPIEWKKACKYICKEDKTIELDKKDQLDADGIDIDSIWSKNNVKELMEDCKNLRDVIPLLALYDLKPIEWGRPIKNPIKSEDDMFEWQLDIIKSVKYEPDDRIVNWIYDKNGGKGKTQFIKYCWENEKEKMCWITPNGTQRDIMALFYEELKGGWRGDTIMINLAKSATAASDMCHIYTVIENFKDGTIYTSKYKGGKMMTPSFHVWVYSNMFPDVERLSEDRWNILKIGDKKEFVPVTLKKGAQIITP